MGRGWRGQMLTSLSSRATGGAGLYQVFWVNQKKRALDEKCPRAALPGFDQAWSHAAGPMSASRESSVFPPHPFAETQVMPDQVEEHIRVLAHGRDTTAPPFACDYDTMTLDEFCALFTIRGWKHRATIQSVFRAHQHNRHAGPAGVHILTLEAFTSQADSIPCCACGVSKPRKHLDRLKKGSCPVAVADQTRFTARWHAALRSVLSTVSQLHTAAPD